MQSPKEIHMSVLGLMYIEPTIRSTLFLTQSYFTKQIRSPVESVGAKEDGGKVGALLPAEVELARGGEGWGEVLEGALQPSEEEVEHGHEGDKEEPVPGPKVTVGVLLVLLLLLHHIQPPALLHLQATLLHHLAGVDHIVDKVAQGVDGKAHAKETIESVNRPNCFLWKFC